MTLADDLRERRRRLTAAGLWRDPRPSRGVGVDLCSNDYLGLASLGETGTGAVALEAPPGEGPGRWAPDGAGASRLVEGDHTAHREAEGALASWVGAEAALLFSSGYAANLGTLAALAGPGDRIVSDVLNHASIIDGCRLSRAEVVVTPHLDLDAVDRALAAPRAGAALVVTESLFSMDGDGPDLGALRALCDRHGAALVVDEAHALGVLGPAGAGRCAAASVRADALVGTLGKALGLHGAFVAGSEELRAWLWNRARSFVFSTGVAPRLAQVAAARVRQVAAAERDRRRLVELRSALLEALGAAGLPAPSALVGPIVPVPFPSGAAALAAAERARRAGFRVVAIRPPTVPVGGARLRLTLRPALDAADFPRLAAALRDAAGATGEPGPDGDRAPSPTDEQGLFGASPGVGPRCVVVAGTGTGVGKTAVGVALLEALRRRAPTLPTAGVKLLETGVAPDAPDSDAARLARAGTAALGERALVTFPEPLSPHLAARRAGVTVTVEGLVEALAAALRGPGADTKSRAPEPALNATTRHVVSLVIVETAGGLFSPLNERQTNEDVAAQLDPELLVLVAPDRLGVLHEVAACRRALRPALRTRTVVVLDRPTTPDGSTGTNAAELERLGLGPVLAVVPGLDGAEPAVLDAALARLVDAALGAR